MADWKQSIDSEAGQHGAFRLTSDLPDLSEKSVREVFVKATQSALRYHRWKFLPFHFSKAAFERYPLEYALSTSKSNPLNSGRDIKQVKYNPNTLSPKRRAYYESQKGRQARSDLASASRDAMRQAKLVSKDRRNEIPLYDTGRTKSMVLSGSYSFAGKPGNYRMEIPVPPYISYRSYRSDGKAWDKRAAAEAVINQEVEAFAANMDASFQKHLDQHKSATAVSEAS